MGLQKMILPVFFTFSLLFSLSSTSKVFDYCVGDLSLPSGPNGFSCKDPANVTTLDFVYTGLNAKSNTSNLFKVGTTDAFSAQFPGLNGMGISIARVDMEEGGVFPVHSHRVAELLIMIEGSVIAAFIDTNNTGYGIILNKGDIMVIPPTLLHFLRFVGSTPVVAYTVYPSENPGVQVMDTALFGNVIPTEILAEVTLLDHAQVKKLKKIFGGTN